VKISNVEISKVLFVQDWSCLLTHASITPLLIYLLQVYAFIQLSPTNYIMSAYALHCFPPIPSLDYEQNQYGAYSFEISPEITQSIHHISNRFADSMGEIVVKVTLAKIDFARLCRTGLHPVPQLAYQGAQLTSHEEAMELDLDIRMNGRCYSASRSLSRIVQLRRDIQREYKTQVVPELPTTLQQGHRGFAMLKELCARYAPEMHEWFARVTLDFHESSALNSFLWEPLEQQQPLTTLNGSKSFSTLGSIPEHDGDSWEWYALFVLLDTMLLTRILDRILGWWCRLMKRMV